MQCTQGRAPYTPLNAGAIPNGLPPELDIPPDDYMLSKLVRVSVMPPCWMEPFERDPNAI